MNLYMGRMGAEITRLTKFSKKSKFFLINNKALPNLLSIDFVEITKNNINYPHISINK